VRLVVAGAALVLCGPAGGADAPRAERWEETIRGFEQWDRKNWYPKEGVLFVGSSSIVGWATREHFPDVPVLNRGFGGSTIADSNHYIDRIVVPYRPRVIVLYAGDNDIAAGMTPERVRDDYRTFGERVHGKLPAARIIFVSIKPSRLRWKLWPVMKEANRLIEAYSQEGPRLIYADAATPMLNKEGEPRDELLACDGLHLSKEGYKLWTRLIAPLIEKAMQEPAAD
jgi:lysophospholipase L1-like esterase